MTTSADHQHIPEERILRSRRAPDRLRGLAGGAQKGAAHPFPVGEAVFDGDHIERVAALLQHQPGGFHAQFLDGPCRRLPGFGAESAAELARAQIRDLRQLLDTEARSQILPREDERALNTV